VLLGLPHDLDAVPKRAGSAARDALRIGIESDAQQCVAFPGERAKAFEVAQANQS
jgi:hypothetical protein